MSFRNSAKELMEWSTREKRNQDLENGVPLRK